MNDTEKRVMKSGMNLYQVAAMRTKAKGLPFEADLAVLALGLAGEAGEVAEKVKKFLAHGHKMDVDAVGEELGDVLWYLAVMAKRLGLDLGEVAAGNVAKLEARYPDGFRLRQGEEDYDGG